MAFGCDARLTARGTSRARTVIHLIQEHRRALDAASPPDKTACLAEVSRLLDIGILVDGTSNNRPPEPLGSSIQIHRRPHDELAGDHQTTVASADRGLGAATHVMTFPY